MSNECVIMDGKALAAEIRTQLRDDIMCLRKGPGLAVIQVGENPASSIYVRNKEKACAEIGMASKIVKLPENIPENRLIGFIEELNADKDYSGILVQLPLPPHIDEKRVLEAISPEKDVDCFTRVNMGKLMTGDYKIGPCTPSGILELLKKYNIEISGKHCVIVGRSNIVGKPMALMMLKNDATVTICHSKTADLADKCREADILICAVGKKHVITKDMIKPGAVVIDVGINRDENGKLAGDVDTEGAKEVASYITPVPGGVGPMTIAMLLKNTVIMHQSK